jgi:mannose-6-phosphate isomerase
VHVLDNPIRDYAWGSTSALATFLDREPSGAPEAELWVGAHAVDPSRLPDGRRLDEEIAARPGPTLGPDVAERFGGRLPFLTKVLAVEQVLSLQVHPSHEQARRGHAREESAGLPLDSPLRSYPDPWHKPELVFALTPFETLAGFRDVSRTAELLRMLGVPWADGVAARLVHGDPPAGVRAVVEDTLALSGSEVRDLVSEVSAARTRVRYADPEAARVLEILGYLADRYPDDPGVLVSLLLNDVVLQPGEALMVQPGVVHAHGSGLALEIMATSDNVLRAGLTPKHRDVAELLAATDFRPIPPPRCLPTRTGPGFARFTPPVEEFELTVARPPVDSLPASGPRVLIALDDTVEVAAGGRNVEVGRGRAVFIEHDDGPMRISGSGWVAVGAVPERTK